MPVTLYAIRNVSTGTFLSVLPFAWTKDENDARKFVCEGEASRERDALYDFLVNSHRDKAAPILVIWPVLI